jgi:uncharacterized lipoprotein NlpE involved in copper resistance
MKSIVAVALVAFFLMGCSHRDLRSSAANAAEDQPHRNSMSEDEKHRLYTAALAVSESPLDTKLFSDVCKKIGIYDVEGKPTDRYMSFVQAHIDWVTRSENEHFRQEINSQDKARHYLTVHLVGE